VPVAGVPAKLPIPPGGSENVTPEGSVPDSVIVAAGLPVVITEKAPVVPTVNVALVPLVMAGGVGTALTVSVKL
jgi:hypothetical protein